MSKDLSARRAPELGWATSIAGGGGVTAASIATDSRGNSYVTGSFAGTATFGAGEPNETVLQAVAPNVVFVAKYARDGTLRWVTSASPSSRSGGSGIATTPGGNSYVTGQFEGTATFGAGGPNETVLEAVGGQLFVAKYAPDGTLLWARSATSAGPISGTEATGIAVDSRGSSYATGIFVGTAAFGGGEPHETVLEAANYDVLVAKYGRGGTLRWARSASGPDFDGGMGIATHPSGDSYVTGVFHDATTFGAGEANETVLEAVGGGAALFVAKYARNGTLLWATSASGTSNIESEGIATDPGGNSYVTGSFEGTATFGTGEPNEAVLSGAGIFVAKYAGDGTLLWATSAGGASFDAGKGIAADSRGGSYVTGVFSGTAAFGAGEPNETVLEAADFDVFVAKYAQDGTLVWATSAAGAGIDGGRAIAVDRRGSSYVVGNLEGTATFGAGEPNETVLSAAGGFVAKYGAGHS
jgi:hypothetical protein